MRAAEFVIPIEESLLYVRPLYLRAAGGRILELKRVIVAHQNQIVMEATLDVALNRLFGAALAPPCGSGTRAHARVSVTGAAASAGRAP